MAESDSSPDVFLSYSRADQASVESLRTKLREAGVRSFLDRANLPAGQPWQPFLERELGRTEAVAVFLGPKGMGSWQHREVQVALDRQGRDATFPVIPVLLPGLDDEPTGFLSLQTWIDLRRDLDDPTQLQNLIAAIRRQAPEDASVQIKAAICPYRGLLPFREEDAPFFFGRDAWVSTVTEKVQRHPIVAVIGRSGSGKSSLVYAGLFPELRKSPGGATWDMLALRPGSDPFSALAEIISPPPEGLTRVQRETSIARDSRSLANGEVRLSRLVEAHLADQPGTDRLLLYVDQWEELYTQSVKASDEAERERKRAIVDRFIDVLFEATRDGPATLVFTGRADFYDRLLGHRNLPAVLQNQQISLGPLSRAQLQDCVERPALVVGLGSRMVWSTGS